MVLTKVKWPDGYTYYNYSIQIRYGMTSQNADALYRRPCSGKKCICQTLQNAKDVPMIDCNLKNKYIGI